MASSAAREIAYFSEGALNGNLSPGSFQLMAHQRTAGLFLAQRQFALLMDDPGLGKTVSSVHGADLAGCQKILVLCPAVVRPHWAREFTRWQQIPRTVTVLNELPKAAPGPGVTIVSHEALARTPEMLAAGAPYDLIVCDESHFFRDWNAKRTKHFVNPREIRWLDPKGNPEIVPPGAWTWTHRLWCLTGTPIVNSACDLWPLFYGPLRASITWYDFGNKFTTMVPTAMNGEKPTGLRNASELATWLRPFVLRRTLESVGIDLPPLRTQTVGIDLPEDAMAEILAGLENWTPQMLVNALENNSDLKDANLMRVRRVLGIAKALPVAKYVWDQIVNQNSGPVVVFFQHSKVKDDLYAMFTEQCKFKVTVIDGKTSPKQLAAAESGFQAGEFDILLAQTQSAGQGITLHKSHTCVTAEAPWTATALLQSWKRVHRIGQRQPCTATIIKVNGLWLEEIMSGIITKKQRASEDLLTLLTSNA